MFIDVQDQLLFKKLRNICFDIQRSSGEFEHNWQLIPTTNMFCMDIVRKDIGQNQWMLHVQNVDGSFRKWIRLIDLGSDEVVDTAVFLDNLYAVE
jgi:hypothetical protein